MSITSPRIVCAPDSFKGSASAPEAAAALARGARQVFPHSEIVELPFADGGEGTLDALLAVWGTQAEEVDVVDALGRPATALFGRSPDGRTAVIEAAQANGLPQVSDVPLRPLRADTFGVGMIAAHVLDEVDEILLCIGGSASTDGGTGLLTALGARFLDDSGHEVDPGGQGLASIVEIDVSDLHPRATEVRWRIAVDVDNPLTGPRGAAAVFGPQKGADEQDVATLDAGLAQLARVLSARAGTASDHQDDSVEDSTEDSVEEIAERRGFGAAGGIPVTTATLLRAEVVPGSQMVADAVGLSDALSGADLVLTGEGSLDSQSLDGKVVAAVRRHAPQSAAVIVVAGTVRLTPAECREAGVTAALSIAPGAASLETLLEEALPLIEDAAAHACALAAV
ncbi:MAG: glycerate kinase [Nesterenkonia sp.]|nr:glycerate kinase [Nesterenkonia sp.]